MGKCAQSLDLVGKVNAAVALIAVTVPDLGPQLIQDRRLRRHLQKAATSCREHMGHAAGNDIVGPGAQWRSLPHAQNEAEDFSFVAACYTVFMQHGKK